MYSFWRCRSANAPMTLPEATLSVAYRLVTPVADVVVGLSFGNALAQWQDRLSAFQRLNLRFLVNAQHNCVLRWVQVQSHNVFQLLFKIPDRH